MTLRKVEIVDLRIVCRRDPDYQPLSIDVANSN